MEEKIAAMCLEKYRSFKSRGKPLDDEWTVLSGIVLQKQSNELILVSLCSGTKCLSGKDLQNTHLGNRGIKLSDSHAEILAKRAFQRYLYHQLECIFKSRESDIFCLEQNKVELKKGVLFHFFSSQTPCGDCSIIPKYFDKDTDESSPLKKPKFHTNISKKFGDEIVDIYRTGAKCLEFCEKQDPLERGVSYHTVGLIRTKPGRGDRTLSLSCSDKIARWITLGVQGALLSLMIPSIHFKNIVIGGGCPFSLEVMKRGLFERFKTENNLPCIVQSKTFFEHLKNKKRSKPCPSSIIWCAIPKNEFEVSVNGIKQGATKKSQKCQTSICRKAIFSKFLVIYDLFLNDTFLTSHPKKLMYYHFKLHSRSYQNLWREKRKLFEPWPVKPFYLQEILSFPS